MPISQDLFMAILVVDSYNRGFDAGIGDGQNVVNGFDEDGLGAEGSQIGNAVVSQQDVSEAAEAAGFYAVAYQWNGETVISYRDTDNANPRPWDPFLRLSTQCGTWMDHGMDPQGQRLRFACLARRPRMTRVGGSAHE